MKKLSYASVMDTRTYRILGEFAQDNKEFREAIDALYGKQRLFTHSEALRSAFSLTGDEYDQIVATLRYNASTPLTLANISKIFRYGWLARTLVSCSRAYITDFADRPGPVRCA